MELFYGILAVVFLSCVREVDSSSDICRNLPYKFHVSVKLKSFGGKCYQFVPKEMYWHGANNHCRKYGGSLVKIPDPDTNKFLVDTLNNLWWKNNGVWIGLNDIEEDGHFRWSNKSAYGRGEDLGVWSNWGNGHPGAFLSSYRNCIRMVRGDGLWKWHETLCETFDWKYRFICEYEPEFSSRLMSSTSSTPKREKLHRPTLNVNEFLYLSIPQSGNLNVEQSTLSISEIAEIFEKSEPPAPMSNSLQGGSHGALGNLENDNQDSKVVTISIMCVICILILLLAAVLFKYRQKRRLDLTAIKKRLQEKRLEEVICGQPHKTENVYIDEETQKFVHSKEISKITTDDVLVKSNSSENIYEEIK